MSNVIVHIPICLKTWGGRKIIISPQGKDLRHNDNSVRIDDTLIKALAKGYLWRKQLETEKYSSIEDIMDAEQIKSSSYIQRLIRLTTLSPRIIEKILSGQQPSGFNLNHTKKSISPIWSEQEKELGF